MHGFSFIHSYLLYTNPGLAIRKAKNHVCHRH